MQAPVQTSVHELLQMRGDMALAGLKTIHANLKTLVDGIGAVLEEMERLETHYALSDTAGRGPMASLLASVRKMRPAETEGKTDEEVMTMFNLGVKR